MDKANANFDSANATKDRYGNITARNQSGLTVAAIPRKSAKAAKLDAMEKDMLPGRDKNS